MLKNISGSRAIRAGGSIAIVASEYNPEFVDGMLQGASVELRRAKVERVKIVRVPGAFEIPAVASFLARQQPRWGAIICLGIILRGQTTHAQFIGQAVTDSLARIQVETQVPVIHEVLLLENEDQARARCLNPKQNRGREAAITAVRMIGVMQALARKTG